MTPRGDGFDGLKPAALLTIRRRERGHDAYKSYKMYSGTFGKNGTPNAHPQANCPKIRLAQPPCGKEQLTSISRIGWTTRSVAMASNTS